MNGGVALVDRGGSARGSQRRLATRYLDERADILDEALARVDTLSTRAANARSIALGPTPPTCCRSSSRRGVVPDVRDRSDLGARRAERLRAQRHVARRSRRRCAARNPDEYVAAVDGGDGRARARDAGPPSARGAVTFDYGNNIRAQAQKAGVARRVRHSRLRAGIHPPALLPGQGAVPLGGALRRSRRHRRDRSARARDVQPTTRRCAGGFASPPSAWRFRDCPRGSSGSATASARSFGLAINDLVRRGERQGADRDRPRPPRHRIGRLAQPRDRRHARWQRRHRRLAGAERAAQHVVRAPRGSRSITAAASASATRCTPEWSSSPTARAKRTKSCNGCSRAIPASGSCGTRTPVIRKQLPWRARVASICR